MRCRSQDTYVHYSHRCLGLLAEDNKNDLDAEEYHAHHSNAAFFHLVMPAEERSFQELSTSHKNTKHNNNTSVSLFFGLIAVGVTETVSGVY